MTIRSFRICKTHHAAAIWTGNGARNHGGRWNSKGIAVIYTAENRSLAALEQLVHLIKPRILKDFVVAQISFEESHVRRIEPRDLPADWNHPVAPASLKRFGDEWIADGSYAVLAAPSAVVPNEWNYLVNPAHADFPAMRKSDPEPFIYDDRLG